MSSKNRMRRSLRSPGKNILWLGVRLLAIVTLVSLPLVSIVFTDAKSLRGGENSAGARVAKWQVRLLAEDLPALRKNGLNIPADGNPNGHPLVLFFEGIDVGADPNAAVSFVRKDATFPVELINESEVSARFTAIWETDSGTADFHFYDGTTDVTSTGVELAPETSKVVKAVIKSSTFTGLRFGAHAEQVN